MPIIVGSTCADRGDGATNYTLVSKGNPAGATGEIDYVCLWWTTGDPGTDVDVGAFSASGNNLTCVEGAYVNLPDRGVGKQEYNAPGDFSAFDINSGEYIGCYTGTTGNLDYGSINGYDEFWYVSGADHIPCSGQAFTLYGSEVSIYATGTEAGVAPTGVFYGPFIGPFGGPI